MLTDLDFYLLGIPAVLLYGIAKGGFGGAIAILAVPLMSLMMAPSQAAAILLPILVLMDFVVVYSFRGHCDRRALKLLLPGALVGIGLGWLFADVLSEALTRLLVGSIAIAFGTQFLLGSEAKKGREHRRGPAVVFGMIAGFTSFSIHAGGPPFTMYMLPKRLPPMVFAGTAGVFFMVVNLVKLPPYYALGLFTAENLSLSAVLMPFAPLGVLLGRFLVRRSPAEVYYRLIAAFLVVVGLKLLHDGLTAL